MLNTVNNNFTFLFLYCSKISISVSLFSTYIHILIPASSIEIKLFIAFILKLNYLNLLKLKNASIFSIDII